MFGSRSRAFLASSGLRSGPGGSCVYVVLTTEQATIPAARVAVCCAVRALWDAWCAEKPA